MSKSLLWIQNRPLRGEMHLPPSKSEVLRLILLAACGNKNCRIVSALPPLCSDIRAMLSVAEALGADWASDENGLWIFPNRHSPLDVCDVGACAAALRLSVPVTMMLGLTMHFRMRSVLWQRVKESLKSFAAECENTTYSISEQDGETLLYWQGRLPKEMNHRPSNSSQLLSGLALAYALNPERARKCCILGAIPSQSYLALTLGLLKRYDSDTAFENNCLSSGKTTLNLPTDVYAESDFSAAVFPLTLAAWGQDIAIACNVPEESLQGDAAFIRILQRMGAEYDWHEGILRLHCEKLQPLNVDCNAIPDASPLLALTMAAVEGESCLSGLHHLHLKECDRFHAVPALLRRFGIEIEEKGDDAWRIVGRAAPKGGFTVNCLGDHRIVMLATAAALTADAPVGLENAECVDKSWPGFFEECERSGMLVTG